MTFSQLFFGFIGRIPRRSYWLALLVVSVYIIFIIGVAAVMQLGLLILFILFVPALFAMLALGAKRLHDRDKSAWWLVFIYFVPGVLERIGDASGDIGIVFLLASLAISIWALVELGFLRGTPGPNRFGPDPLPRAYPA